MALTKKIIDKRDNRGKRHDLAFIIMLVLLALLSGRSSVSGIHRFMRNRYGGIVLALGDKMQVSKGCISRAQLPRVLAIIEWTNLFELSCSFIAISPSNIGSNSWISIDGKELRGSLRMLSTGKKETRGEAIISAVEHKTGQIVAHTYYHGDKESEITCVRQLLKDTELSQAQITVDALHSNPLTTALIAQAMGVYLVQVKANQAELLAQLKSIPAQIPLGGEWEEVEKANGRMSIRNYKHYNIKDFDFDQRWNLSNISTLCVVNRQFTEIKTGEIMQDTAFYISNKMLPTKKIFIDLANAIRRHWTVENGHQIRDVTFKEDHIRTIYDNISRNLAILRTIAIEFIRKFNFKSFAEAIDNFDDNMDLLFTHLISAKFL